MKRKVCIATGTRADWGLLSNIAKALNSRQDVDLQIIATNTHLSPKFGNTYKEIEADGLKISFKVPVETDDDTAYDTVKSMGRIMTGFAEAFDTLKPDILVILGDRYEMLAVASTATIYRIPIAHIAGGTISEGAYDENIRHSITKMSHIHLTETEEYRKRVIQLGENPEHVINTGAIGVYNIKNIPLLPKEEVEQYIGIKINENTVQVTFHPATLDSISTETQCMNLLAALDRHPECNIIFTYPNNDTDSKVIIELLENFVSKNRQRAVIFPSLGMKRFLSLLKYISGVIGNSSSGIVEVPSMGIPTLDIGIRQKGRIAADSVIHCGTSIDEIDKGIKTILSPEFKVKACTTSNPYEQKDTLDKIVKAICETPLENIIRKPFYDLR